MRLVSLPDFSSPHPAVRELAKRIRLMEDVEQSRQQGMTVTSDIYLAGSVKLVKKSRERLICLGVVFIWFRFASGDVANRLERILGYIDLPLIAVDDKVA